MANEEFTLPSAAELEAIKADAVKVAEAVSTVLGFVEKYGSLVPGLSAIVPEVTAVAKVVTVVETFLNEVSL